MQDNVFKDAQGLGLPQPQQTRGSQHGEATLSSLTNPRPVDTPLITSDPRPVTDISNPEALDLNSDNADKLVHEAHRKPLWVWAEGDFNPVYCSDPALSGLIKSGSLIASRPTSPEAFVALEKLEVLATASLSRQSTALTAPLPSPGSFPIIGSIRNGKAKSTVSPSIRSWTNSARSSSEYSSVSMDSGIYILPEDRDKKRSPHKGPDDNPASVPWESHNPLERTQQDDINERLQGLSYLGPFHGLEDEKVRKALQNNSPLSPTLTGLSAPQSPFMHPAYFPSNDDLQPQHGKNFFFLHTESSEEIVPTQDSASRNDSSLSTFSPSTLSAHANIFPAMHQSERQSAGSLSTNEECHLPSVARSAGSFENADIPIIPPEHESGDDECSSFAEYETDLEEDDTADGFQDFELFTVRQKTSGGADKACGEVISRVLSPMQQALLDRMMTEFWLIFHQANDLFPEYFRFPPDDAQQEPLDAGDGHEQSNTDQPVSRTESALLNGIITPGNPDLKRKRGNQKDQNDEDDDGRNRKRPKLPSSEPKDLDDSSKFACPYRKHNPSKYGVQKWRPCALTPLETVARVKAHLYRHHCIFPCLRCKQLFKNQDEVNLHLQALEGCILAETDLGDGLTSDIVNKLKSRKKSDQYQTESERWGEIYMLLFPNQLIPDPYFEAVQENLPQSPDSREFTHYEEFCRQELPRSVRAALENSIRSQSHPIEERLMGQLVTIVRDCQDRVFSRYKELVGSATGSPMRARTGSAASIVISSMPPADNMPSDKSTVTNRTTKHSPPAFLRPPPPQNHLGSQPLPNAVLMPDLNKPTSDSGYASTSSDNLPSSYPWTENDFSGSSFKLAPQAEPEQAPDPSLSLEQSLDLDPLVNFGDPNADLSSIFDSMDWSNLQ